MRLLRLENYLGFFVQDGSFGQWLVQHDWDCLSDLEDAQISGHRRSVTAAGKNPVRFVKTSISKTHAEPTRPGILDADNYSVIET